MQRDNNNILNEVNTMRRQMGLPVLNENEFWDIIEQLKSAGAQGILVVPIEKMII
jgi:ATP phosphoribosyltransferase